MLFLAFLTASCSHKVTTSIANPKMPLSPTAKVMIIGLDESVPDGAIKLGKVKLGDSGFSMKCTWYEAIAKAKIEARKAGGNILKITKHKKPNFFTSACHRVWADIYMLESLKDDGEEDLEYRLMPKLVAGIDYPKSRIGIKGGWSNRIGKAPQGSSTAFKKYIKELKSGGHFGVDYHYFLSPVYGIGGAYSTYFSKAGIDNYTIVLDDGSSFTGDIKEDIMLNYFGVSGMTRYPFNEKNMYSFNFGLGYLGYQNKQHFSNAQGGELALELQGATLGTELGFGVDFGLTKNLSLGLQFNFLGGVLTKYTISADGKKLETIKLEEDQAENIGRIDLSVGLRYYLGVPAE